MSRALLAALVAAFTLATNVVRAEGDRAPSAEEIEQAARAFDAGVEAFERAEYPRAVRQFLRADALVPNTDALWNALAAAERAKHDALVATVAERAASREATSPKLAARAKKTLAEVEPKVARIVVACEPKPCELTMDGEPLATGASYTLPGSRLIAARGANGSATERRVEAAPAHEYALTLELEPAHRPAVAGAPAPAPRREGEAPAPRAFHPERDEAARPLSPAVFYTGVGLTLVLAGATAWSGIDTLKAKNELPGSASDNEDVMSRAHRTDALLLGTVLMGSATATAGFLWTDWGGSGGRVTLTGSLVQRGALLSITGTH